MYRTDRMNEAIKASGLKKTYIADRMTMKYDTFVKKVNGIVQWKSNEISLICDILRLTSRQRNYIFFDKE